jgi:hypothetical protein
MSKAVTAADHVAPPAGARRSFSSTSATKERLGNISDATLYRMIGDGQLRAFKLRGKTVIDDASIEEVITTMAPVGEI